MKPVNIDSEMKYVSGKEQETLKDEDIGMPLYFPEMDDNGDQLGNYDILYLGVTMVGNV